MSQAVAKPSRPNQGRDARRLRLTDLAERTRVLDPSFPLREAAELLLREGARTLLVGEPAGEILGVVDARGLLEALVQGRDPTTPVRAVMRVPGQVLPLPLPEAGVEIRGDHLVLTRGGREASVLCTCRNFQAVWSEWAKRGRELADVAALNHELEGILSASYDGVIVTDAERFLRANESWRRITGLSPKDLEGKRWAELPDDGHVCLRAVKEVLSAALEQGQPATRMRQVRSGNEIYFTANPILDQAGHVLRVVCNVRDVTELNRLRAELERVRSLSERYQSELAELRARQLQPTDFVAESRAMRRVLDLVYRAAKVDATVLIAGESGVGKELVAKFVHRMSPREAGPCIFINCGAIPETLVESELFGYEKGAFTGANREGKPGLFELANHGTLVLDEVSELPLPMQVKLLRAIQEGEIFRIGGVRPVRIDLRLVACTNQRLEERVREGKFREDLYWRLNVIPLEVPPLRDRREDILPLLNFFLGRFGEKYGAVKRLEMDAYQLLESYDWPGNVRELEHVVERLVVLTPGEVIRREHLPENLAIQERKADDLVTVRGVMPLAEARELLEQKLLEQAMEAFGSARRAAQALGVDHSTVVRRLKRQREAVEA